MTESISPKCSFKKINPSDANVDLDLRMWRKVDDDIFGSVKSAENKQENPFGTLSSIPISLRLFNNFPDHQKVINFHK